METFDHVEEIASALQFEVQKEKDLLSLLESANKDAEAWLRAVMTPMETQIREHQVQLKRRLESIKRIHQATDTLEDRISELESIEKSLLEQINALEAVVGRVRELLLPPPAQLRAA